MDLSSIETSLNGLKLKTPIIACSGTWGYGCEGDSFSALPGLGALVTKGLTLHPRQGNPPPRLFECRAGLLNAIGLENVGVESFLKDKIPALPKDHPPIVANIAGESMDDYVALTRILSREPAIVGIELNVSCPNKDRGLAFGTDCGLIRELTRAVKEVACDKRVIVKLTPNVTQIAPIAEAAASAGADALSMINTVTGMAIDWVQKKPVFHRITAGLSGPAIKPVALAAVWQCHAVLGRTFPLIGMGGIQTWTDALEFMLAGATAVGIGTAAFVDPFSCNTIAEGLASYLRREGLSSLASLVGAAHAG